MLPYLIVSDVDGTLAFDHATISSRTQATVNRVLDAGHVFYLATGRMYNLAALMARQIGPRAEIIASNGAVYDFQAGRVHHLIGEPDLLAIEDAAEAFGLPALYFTDDTVYYTTPPDETVQKMLTYFAPEDAKVNVVQLPGRAALVEHAREITNGIVFASKDLEGLAAVKNQLASTSSLHLSASDPHNIELIPQNVDKALAIAELQAKLNIPPERTIAFGDGENDLGMLRAAGISVAMANGVEKVLQVANHRTASNKEDGLAQFLERFFKL